MFGFAKRRAAKAAIEHGSAILRLLETTGGLPRGFWEDPYLVGWISGVVSCVAKAATNNRIGTTDQGAVQIDTFTSLAGPKGKEVVERLAGWMRSKEPKFFEAAEAATKTYFVTVGAREFDADPEVVQARIRAKSMASIDLASSEHAVVGAAMQQLLFYDVVDRMRSKRGSEKP